MRLFAALIVTALGFMALQVHWMLALFIMIVGFTLIGEDPIGDERLKEE